MRYRVRQTLWALQALNQPVDEAFVAAYLPPNLRSLFAHMPRIEKHHSARVLRTILEDHPHPPDDLAVAALLHDVGKSRYPLGVVGKSLAVAVRKLLPPLYARLSALDPETHPYARAFNVYQHHPAWSADLLRAAGATERAVWLAAHHQDAHDQWRDHPYYPLLRQLQRADDAS